MQGHKKTVIKVTEVIYKYVKASCGGLDYKVAR